MPNPWFRLYNEIIDDEKLLLLAFQDRWHYVALLALKNKGVLDENEGEMLQRKLCVKLGLHKAELEELSKRLSDVGLVDRSTFQPLAWNDRQFQSDGSTERVRAYRERVKRSSNVTVTAQDTDTDTDTEKEIGQKRTGPKPKKRFRPPTIEEVAKYCTERKNGIDPELFHAHYDSIGWKTKGGSKLESWKSAVITWEKRNAGNGRGNGNAGPVRIPTGNDMPSLTELGRICKDAGIPGDQLRGRQPDEIRSMLRERGIGQ